MLPSADGRDRNESPKLALTREEQLIYADYLDSIGQIKSAEFFRLTGNFGLNKRKPKKDAKKQTKQISE